MVPRAHLLRGAKQDADLAGPHLAEQLLLFRFGIGIVDKGDLLTRAAGGHQFVPDILINIESPVALRLGQVAEQ